MKAANDSAAVVHDALQLQNLKGFTEQEPEPVKEPEPETSKTSKTTKTQTEAEKAS